MRIGTVEIDDTFAEAFRMRCTRLIITAADESWARAAAVEATGYASSIIACDAEADIEGTIAPGASPDGRPGVSVLLFGFSTDALAAAVAARVERCVLTCPTTSVFSGANGGAGAESEGGDRFELGARLLGGAFERDRVVDEHGRWRVPVVDGELVVDDTAVSVKGIAGGNFLVQGRSRGAALEATRAAIEAIAALPGVITPFPGGVARSGSKVGSRYRGLRASTNEAYCPTVRSRVDTRLHPGANAVYEVIINGTDEESVTGAMRTGALAACESAAAKQLVSISAGNYGGKLGKFHFHLREVLG